MYHAAKKKVYTLLHPEIGDSKWDRVINIFIIVLIVLNVIAVMLETVPSIYEPNKNFFHYFDIVSVAIFTVEYLMRLWSCNHDPKYRHSVHGRIRYMFSFGALIDLLAILPFYITFFIGFDLRVLRILRLLRFLRLFRLTSYMKATHMVINVFKSTRNELLLSLVLALFLRTPGSTGKVYQHPRYHVVECNYTYYCRLWRYVPHHHPGQDFNLNYIISRGCSFGSARRYPNCRLS